MPKLLVLVLVNLLLLSGCGQKSSKETIVIQNEAEQSSVPHVTATPGSSLPVPTPNTAQPITVSGVTQLGLISGATVKLYKLPEMTLIAETQSSSNPENYGDFSFSDVELKDNVYYLLESTGGIDTDPDDDGVVVESETVNIQGKVRAIVSGSQLIKNTVRITALSDIIYQQLDVNSYSSEQLNVKAAYIAGDINDDGLVDYHDILAFNPLIDTYKLNANYNAILDVYIPSIYSNLDRTEQLSRLNSIFNYQINVTSHDFQLVPFDFSASIENLPSGVSVEWQVNDNAHDFDNQYTVTEGGIVNIVAKLYFNNELIGSIDKEVYAATAETISSGEPSDTTDLHLDLSTDFGDGAKITVPAGASRDNNTVKVKRITEGFMPVEGAQISDTLVLLPAGATFSKPVTVALPYYDEAVSENIKIVRYSDDGTVDYIYPTQIDRVNHLVYFETNHFTSFAVVNNCVLDGCERLERNFSKIKELLNNHYSGDVDYTSWDEDTWEEVLNTPLNNKQDGVTVYDNFLQLNSVRVITQVLDGTYTDDDIDPNKKYSTVYNFLYKDDVTIKAAMKSWEDVSAGLQVIENMMPSAGLKVAADGVGQIANSTLQILTASLGLFNVSPTAQDGLNTLSALDFTGDAIFYSGVPISPASTASLILDKIGVPMYSPVKMGGMLIKGFNAVDFSSQIKFYLNEREALNIVGRATLNDFLQSSVTDLNEVDGNFWFGTGYSTIRNVNSIKFFNNVEDIYQYKTTYEAMHADNDTYKNSCGDNETPCSKNLLNLTPEASFVGLLMSAYKIVQEQNELAHIQAHPAFTIESYQINGGEIINRSSDKSIEINTQPNTPLTLTLHFNVKATDAYIKEFEPELKITKYDCIFGGCDDLQDLTYNYTSYSDSLAGDKSIEINFNTPNELKVFDYNITVTNNPTFVTKKSKLEEKLTINVKSDYLSLPPTVTLESVNGLNVSTQEYIQFKAVVTDDGKIVDYNWSFELIDKQGVSTYYNPEYYYDQWSNYNTYFETLTKVSFWSPNEATKQRLIAKLTVTDDEGKSTTNSIEVNVNLENSTPPVAIAKSNETRIAEEEQWVTLNALGDETKYSSSDAEDSVDELRFNWQQTEGPAVTLLNADTAVATFIAPNVESTTQVYFKLTVTDTGNLTDTDDVVINIQNVDDETQTSLIADGFDYPLGNKGVNSSNDAIAFTEQISPELNNSYNYEHNITTNHDRTAISSADTNQWRNAQDIGSFYANYGIHPGEDWNLANGNNDAGESVYAVANGEIIAVRNTYITKVDESFQTTVNKGGWTIVIEHTLKNNTAVYSIYTHVTSPTQTTGVITTTTDDFSIAVGDNVTKGQHIARLATGMTSITYSHLHFEMRTIKPNTESSISLWPSSNQYGYYSHDRSEPSSMTIEQIESAYATMKTTVGLIDPSDFIDFHRSGVNGTVTNLTPTTAPTGQKTTFTITGTNIPSTIAMQLAGSLSCDSVYDYNVTASSAKIDCTPNTQGEQQFYVKNKTGGVFLRGSENLLVNITADVETSPLTVLGTTFLDENFAACVQAKVADTGVTNLSEITDLTCYNQNIIDTTGLEALINLQFLFLSHNQLTSIDISNNIALTDLYLDQNQLSNIEVSNNIALTNLDLDQNQLSNIDVSNNIALIGLHLKQNQLSNIDVSNNTMLTELNLYDNPISSINLGGNTALGDENDYINFVADDIDRLFPDENFAACVRANVSLYLRDVGSVFCSGQNITDTTGLELLVNLQGLDLRNNSLTSIDVSHNTSLTYLSLAANQLTSIDVSNNTVLTALWAQQNQLTSIDISHNTELIELVLDANQLNNIDVSNNTALTLLWAQQNQLTSIDVSNNTALTKLGVQFNQLTSIDVSNNTALTDLSLRDNQLTSINVSNNTVLTELRLHSNQLNSIDVSNNTTLTSLDLHNNQLTSINLSNNMALKILDLSSNKLTSIDIGNNTALIHLNIGLNQLTSINVNSNVTLTHLYLYNNQLTSIDVSHNTALVNLSLQNNQITNIDIGNNTILTDLDLQVNQLSSIDVSNNTALTYLGLSQNPLTSIYVGNNSAVGDLSHFLLQTAPEFAPEFSSGVYIEDSNAGFSLSWNNASGIVTYYEVHRSTQSGVLGGMIYLNNDTATIDSSNNLISGETYYYTALACNGAGCTTGTQNHKTYLSGAVTQYPTISSLSQSNLHATDSLQTFYIYGDNFTPLSTVYVDYGSGYQLITNNGVEVQSSTTIKVTVKTTSAAFGTWQFKVLDDSIFSNVVGMPINVANNSNTPNLIAEVSVNKNSYETGETINFNGVFRNIGDTTTPQANLTFYYSEDNIISIADTEIGTNNSTYLLSPNEVATKGYSIGTEGEYYFGVCVEPVVNEVQLNDNCSDAIKITIQD